MPQKDKVTETPAEPWNRMPGESGSAFEHFVCYRDLGTSRTLRAAWRKYVAIKKLDVSDSPPGSWKRRCKVFKWEERAAAWDRWRDSLQNESMAEVIKEDAKCRARAELLDERRQKQQDDEWELRNLLVQQAKEMLIAKLYRQRTKAGENGEQIIEIAPARWSKFTAVQMVEMALKLGRINLKMPTEIEKTQDTSGIDDQLFETDGQFESAMPEGAVQPMPADVLEKPEIKATDEGAGGPAMSQPAKPVRPA